MSSFMGSMYKFVGVASAGPFDSSGSNATLSCTLRATSPDGVVLATWGSSGVFGIAPPYAGTILFDASAHVQTLYVCSQLTWETANGPQAAGGCENTGILLPFGGSSEVWVVSKPQDTDLDSNWP